MTASSLADSPNGSNVTSAVRGAPCADNGPHDSADYLRGAFDLVTRASLNGREDLGCAAYVR